MKTVKEVMTTEIFSVHTQQNLSEVSKLFRDHDIHHVPVLDGQKPVGIINTRDIYKLVFDVDHTDQRMMDAMLDHQFSIADVMRKEFKTLSQKAKLKDATDVLKNGDVHSVIIIDDDGHIVGIVTTTDLIKYLHEQL